jgi:sensor domain CHASE-containing protein
MEKEKHNSQLNNHKLKAKSSKLKAILIAVLPGLIVAGLIFGANVYYDLDLGKVIMNEITKIIDQLETTATTTLATVSGKVGIATTTLTRTLTYRLW